MVIILRLTPLTNVLTSNMNMLQINIRYYNINNYIKKKKKLSIISYKTMMKSKINNPPNECTHFTLPFLDDMLHIPSLYSFEV